MWKESHERQTNLFAVDEDGVLVCFLSIWFVDDLCECLYHCCRCMTVVVVVVVVVVDERTIGSVATRNKAVSLRREENQRPDGVSMYIKIGRI